jgi:hypothetical protein
MLVGGTKEEFIQVDWDLSNIPDAHHMQRRTSAIRYTAYGWRQRMSLIVLGTKRDTQSYYWTSPMKLFEYMTSKRPDYRKPNSGIRKNSRMIRR